MGNRSGQTVGNRTDRNDPSQGQHKHQHRDVSSVLRLEFTGFTNSWGLWSRKNRTHWLLRLQVFTS